MRFHGPGRGARRTSPGGGSLTPPQAAGRRRPGPMTPGRQARQRTSSLRARAVRSRPLPRHHRLRRPLKHLLHTLTGTHLQCPHSKDSASVLDAAAKIAVTPAADRRRLPRRAPLQPPHQRLAHRPAPRPQAALRLAGTWATRFGGLRVPATLHPVVVSRLHPCAGTLTARSPAGEHRDAADCGVAPSRRRSSDQAASCARASGSNSVKPRVGKTWAAVCSRCRGCGCMPVTVM